MALEGAGRSALERMNVRLDNGFGFERHTVRGKDRMTARMGLALPLTTAVRGSGLF